MKILVLTGAGISAESGLGAFRDKRGLWSFSQTPRMLLPGDMEKPIAGGDENDPVEDGRRPQAIVVRLCGVGGWRVARRLPSSC